MALGSQLCDRGNQEDHDLDTGQIKQWRSIITLIVFVLTSKWAVC
jgi:hypothetical protein